MSTDRALPRVPDLADPRHETPLTEGFRTGTANDPPLARRGARADDTMVHLTVDGTDVAMAPDATLLDAVRAAGEAVPALCHYDRDTDRGDAIGPRTTCRTCVVEVDGQGLVAACSTPVADGLVVQTDAPDAERARDVNLDLVLSDHNLRCTTCGKNGRCELQDTAIEAGVEHPRYGVFDDRSAYEPLDDTAAIQIDRNKCILCNRCVEACNDVQVQGVLRIEDDANGEPRIGFMSEAATMHDSDCVSCGHCATVCPTGSLVEGGLTDATTIPIPGFDQRSSIGTTLSASSPRRDEEDEDDDLTGVARFMKRARQRARSAGETAARGLEHVAEGVAARTLSEGMLFESSTAIADLRMRSIDVTETTCGYCAVGCRFDLYTKGDEVLGVRPVDGERAATHAPMNDFSTCVKGKFGYEFVGSDERLTRPQVRDEETGELVEATWEEALTRVAEGFERIRAEHGRDALAAFASSKCTNEEDYLLQKFARTVLGTRNVDNCARLCHSSTVAALKQTVGFGAMSNSGDDVANADAYLITGSNTTESHPVLATRIKQNVREGATLVVYDPRKVEIAEHADRYVRTRPGFDVAWINGLIRYVLTHDLHDEAFVAERTTGIEALREKVEPFTPEEVERLAGVSPEDLAWTAETLAAADSVVFGWAMGMTQHSHGTGNVLALADLALVLGQVGKENSGLSPFRGHNNVQGGGGDMGTLPNTLPGYQDVTDPDVLDTFEAEWGVRPPEGVGLTVTDVFDAIHEGDVRGLFVMGENPALSEPDIGHTEAALETLDLLVVQDIFPTETTRHADVVLPAASFAEKEGTFTNTERRVQLVGKALDPPGQARQDWEIIQELAGRIDHDGPRWAYDSPEEVMDEIARVTPIYGGITHARLREEGGLQWPCPTPDHPGTRFLYEERFEHPDGKAQLVPADMGEPGELPGETYPLTLTTGRVMYHFHTGTLTRRVEDIMRHVDEAFVEIHPETADRLGVADGERVRVESKRGAIEVRAQVTDRVGRGVVFIPMHFADGAVNTLTSATYDDVSGIPEYKVASVRIAPVDADSGDTGPDADTEPAPTTDDD